MPRSEAAAAGVSPAVRTKPAYVQVRDHIHTLLTNGHGLDESRLPTEAELTRLFRVSRQTVRRAYAELVSEGLVHRAPGRGSFSRRSQRYVMTVDSLDDLLALREDRELRVTRPIGIVHSATAAGKLGLPGDDVAFLAYAWVRDGIPFALNRTYLPPRLLEIIADVGFVHTKGAVSRDPVIVVLDRLLPHPIATAKRTINAISAPAEVAAAIGCEADEPILRIESLYFDADERPVELNINFYHPQLYEYRAHLRRRQSSAPVA